MKKYWWVIVALIGTYVWLNIPVFHDGLFHVYDNVQVTRIIATADELKSGQFPVRYFAKFGHGAGYWILKYYSPLIYYIGAVINWVGFTPIQAVKLVYLLVTAGGVLGMWVLLHLRFQKMAATIGTLVFLTSPYVFHDLFHRGSLTEAAALLLTPWVWWSMVRLRANPVIKNAWIGGLCLAVVMLTHALTAMMVMATIILYWLIMPKKSNYSWMLLGMVLIGWGLSAFNYVPAILERGNTQYENNSLLQRGFLDHPISFNHQWVNAAKEPEKAAYLGMTLMITLMVIIFLRLREQKSKRSYTNLFIILISVGGIFLMDPMSRFLWEKIVYLRYFQFPFRILTIVTPALVWGYSSLIEKYRNDQKRLLLLISLWVVPLIITKPYYRVLGYQYGTNYTVDDPCMTSTWADEYLGRWSIQCVRENIPLVTSLTEKIKITRASEQSNGRRILLETNGEGKIVVGKYYAPEWSARNQNGEELTISPSELYGLIELNIFSNTSQVEIYQTKTMSENVGDWVSAGMIVLLIIGLIPKLGGRKS